MRALVTTLVGLLLATNAGTAPLPRESVPELLRPWIPWVLHGRETIACPPAHDDAQRRVCAWPSELELELGAGGGSFRLRAETFGRETWLPLPGGGEQWPQDVKAGANAVSVAERDGQPHVLLGAGAHQLTGRFQWRELPQSLSLPQAAGIVRASVDGRPVTAQPDAEGRLWLRREDAAAAPEALSLRVFRLVDDDVPLTVTTRYEIAAGGRPRELILPAALLPDFIPVSLDSPLPARLGDDGRLRLQLRPGNWVVELGGRRSAALEALTLPKDSAVPEEVWSFRAHNDVRLVAIEGVSAVDPKQTAMPTEWQNLPAYRLRAGDTLSIKQTRRGDPQPAPDDLRLVRRIWLDFDGGGYTLQDSITGKISRSWRLDVAAPVVLGRVAIDGDDQLVTRMAADGAYGVEVRHGRANISADSRIEGDGRVLPATAWQADFSGVGATLHLPPGWRLLHAGGVDSAAGAWIDGWNLWDFFFVLVSALAAGRLFGVRAGLLFGVALALTWHLPGAPRLAWPVLLALTALVRVLPEGRLHLVATWTRRLALLAVLLVLLPFAVVQVRQALYPSLEDPIGGSLLDFRASPVPAPASAPPPPAAPMRSLAKQRMQEMVADQAASIGAAMPEEYEAKRYRRLDPKARIQTGPGLPDWHWRDYVLSWQGPVERSQQIRLWLLPPAATSALTFLSLILLALALWVAAGRPRRFAMPPAAATLGLTLALALPMPQAEGAAPAHEVAAPVQPVAIMPERGIAPPRSILDELREKLTAAPDCMPTCATLARLHLAADPSRIRLRLEVHALEEVTVPLPGQAGQFRPDRVLAGSATASLRRNSDGMLWARLPRGVTQILMEAPAGEAAALQLTLPMAPKTVSAELSGWTLAGIDARGSASDALVLNRIEPTAAAREEGTRGDALPPFLRVERMLNLADRWTVRTTVRRLGPSEAPAVARIPLIAGEAVNDPSVRVEDGHALVALGQAHEAAFDSTLKEGPALKLVAGREANQVEQWWLDADTRWHVGLGGIAPVHHQDGERWLPHWRPWPGEAVEVAVSRPQGVEGQTLTLDSVRLTLTPGQRATDAAATLRLRSSQGGNHGIELPAEAQLLSIAVDGRSQPLRAEGRTLTLPIEPGVHEFGINWREPRGMDLRFETSALGANLPGVNANVQLALPADRWVIALGGPLLGPAVLFWGVVVVIAVAALGLARTRLAPLGVASWFLLGIGLAQASVGAAALVVAWFIVLAARRRYAASLDRGQFNVVQVVLGLWTVAALISLLDGVHSGLLGYPDMLIQGNGSNGSQLNWYQDRFDRELPTVWVLTLPLWAYRLLMLAWALWLARSILQWARWAWESFSAGGYWRAAPPGEPAWKAKLARRKGAAKPAEPAEDTPPA